MFNKSCKGREGIRTAWYLRVVIIALVTFFQFILSITIGIAWIVPGNDSKMPYGYKVNGQNIGGLSRIQARDLLVQAAEPNLIDIRLTIVDGQKTWSLCTKDFGFCYDYEKTIDAVLQIGQITNYQDVLELLRRQAAEQEVPLQVSWLQDPLQCYLDSIDQDISLPAQDARLEYQDGIIIIIEEKPGEKLNYDAMTAKLAEHIQAQNNETIEVIKTVVTPVLTKQSFAGINTELSMYSSLLTNHQNRTHNIALAAQILNNALVRPGEVFSFNDQVGPRTADQGYRKAPVLMQNGLKDDLGGGVCQLSTSVYNAALKAGLEIVEQASHTLPVAYIAEGKDATVAYGYLDLKFRNNLQYPIAILSSVQDQNLTVRILGNSDDKNMVSEILPEQSSERTSEKTYTGRDIRTVNK